MRQERRRLLKGCAIGCGALALAPVLIGVAVGVRTCVPLGSAGRARSRLDARFGPPGSYTPAPDGAVPAARLRAFLDVRGQLSEPCERFAGAVGALDRIDALDENLGSGREVAGATRSFASFSVDIAPFIGQFFDRRNEALLAAEMGLSEYAYVFALAYREQLADPSLRRELFSEGGPVSPEVLTGLRSSLARQLASLPPGVDRTAIEREVRAMERDPQRLPWADGLPATVEASLAPFRERLDAAFCRVTAGIDMDPDSGRALYIALM